MTSAQEGLQNIAEYIDRLKLNPQTYYFEGRSLQEWIVINPEHALQFLQAIVTKANRALSVLEQSGTIEE